MKYHIVVKFFAVFLAALTLLTALGSAIGIICLASGNLYEKSVDELYEEQMSSTRRSFAVNLAHRYASLVLGGCPEAYLDEYYGYAWMYDTFQPGYYFYTIKDENGNIVESTLEGDLKAAAHYTIQVTDIRYRCAVDLVLDETDTQSYESDATPPETAPDESNVSGETEPDTPEGATKPETEETYTEPELPDETRETEVVSGTDPEPTEDSTLYLDGYWNSETDSYTEFRFRYASLPPYTVDLYLIPGAAKQDPYWAVLKEVWNYRVELFYVLGVSILAFAMCAVYLCCAAGKSSDSREIRPGGLNRVPLDLYAFAAGGGIIMIFLVEWETLGYFIQNYLPVSIMMLVLGGYACCLLFVGFCYAGVTQIKTPGGYWWRHSMVGWCILKVCYGVKWLFRKIVTGVRRMIALLPLIWQWLVTAVVLELWLVLTFLMVLDSDGLFRFLAVMMFLTALAGCVAVVCYGAYCFGILMTGAQNMAKGDLERKIPTKYLVGAFRDFARQLNALADATQLVAEKQMRSERMKTELITNVSHDIKTPLTSLINYVDLLQKPHTEEEGEAYLEVLQRQSLRLKKLVEDLMDMSRASSGNVPVEVTQINAVEAVNQALGEFSDKLEVARLTPIFRAPEGPVVMLADGKLTWRVLSNLLGNAVKYAMPGTRLYLDLLDRDGRVEISLKNISREELNVSADELVERFVRGDTSRNTEGSGLGLNIAKSLMELQHGQLQLLVDGDLFKVTLIFPGAEN